MGWLLELLFEAIRELCSQFIIDMMDIASGMFTEILSCDLDLFVELFGVVGSLYQNAVLPIAVALRRAGFVTMMDDFGSGYSSLNMLKDIDVDVLKVDMNFLSGGMEAEKGKIILSSVIQMAGRLGIPVIVEGVETQEQRDFLSTVGCDYVQGYYYAKPMPQEEYERRYIYRTAE